VSPTRGFWRHRGGALPNLLALAYVAVAHVAGIALLAAGQPLAWWAGVLLTAHSLVVAGYLIHDIAHLSVFASQRVSIVVGELLSWLCGSAYAPFTRIQRMHFRHHADRADLAFFDPRPFIASSPAWFRRIVYVLEWLYVPAVELIMHYQVVLRPFLREEFADERLRVGLMAMSRLAFFCWLVLQGPWVLPGFAIAYLLFLTALFVADAYAHTYEFYLIDRVDQKVPRDGRIGDYDKGHTYSNLISRRWPWLNLLNLNFGYHSAHHDSPSTPWHELPALHRQTYATDAPQVLPYRQLWRSFRKNRLKRIEAQDAGSIGSGPHRADDFLGVHGVSFLSIV
jgi:fatty acid desaturase